jgi:hypothetical protein
LDSTPTIALKSEDIAILILSTQDARYDQFKGAISRGWMARMQSRNLRCYFYSGGHDRTSIRGDQIQVATSDILGHTSEKLLAALKVLVSTHPEIKLVYRTNLSSYLETENFLRFIGQKRLDADSYAGLIGQTTYIREYFYGNRYLHKLFTLIPWGETIRFASGSGFFLGRNRIEALLNSPALDLRLIDDVMVARALKVEPDPGVAPIRFDIGDNDSHKVSRASYDTLLGEGCLYHYRFKTSDRSRDAAMLAAFDAPDFRFACCTHG